MPTMKKKLILTHRSALVEKYGPIQPDSSFTQLQSALQALILADDARGIETTICYLDTDPNLSINQEAPPGYHPGDLPFRDDLCKRAVDEAYALYQPDYMVILGSGDIVPFIALHNPTPGAALRHGHAMIESDLPYACDQPHSTHVFDYLNPTRVVSRIPDVLGDADRGIQVLLETLHHATHFTPRLPDRYTPPWAVSSEARAPIMALNLAQMYGQPTPAMEKCPPHNDDWTEAEYQRLTHIHILHGGRRSNVLRGQDLANTRPHPVAIRGRLLPGVVEPGTVVLERACHGGALYNPAGHTLPLVNLYLSSGACCMVGSTTTNYSSRLGRQLAGDVLVSTFFTGLVNHSIGGAFLLARRAMIASAATLPLNGLAMLAGFNLYGDASLCPMAGAQPQIEPDFDPDSDLAAAVKEPLSNVVYWKAANTPVPDEIRKQILQYFSAEKLPGEPFLYACQVVTDHTPGTVPQYVARVSSSLSGKDLNANWQNDKDLLSDLDSKETEKDGNGAEDEEAFYFFSMNEAGALTLLDCVLSDQDPLPESISHPGIHFPSRNPCPIPKSMSYPEIHIPLRAAYRPERN